MKRRICTVMLIAVFLLCSVAAAADNDRIKFGDAAIVTSEGTTTVTVPLLNKPVGKGATLIAAYMHSDTGRILSVNSVQCADVSLLSENSISVSLSDKSSDGGVLSYYIWNSLADNKSLVNVSPAAPTNVTASEADVSSSSLAWEAALDDYDESNTLTYNIYDGGMIIKENCTDLEYTVDSLAWGGEYNLEVRAVDSEGAESETAQVSAETTMQNTVFANSAAIQITDPGNKTYNNIISSDGNLILAANTNNTETQNSNFSCEKITQSGLDCYKTVLRASNSSPTGLAYHFADSCYADLKDAVQIACELTYFDEGSYPITATLFYTASDGSTASTDRVLVSSRSNTGTWRTVRTVIDVMKEKDGKTFALAKNDHGNGFYTIKIRSSSDYIKIHSFTAIPLYETDTSEEYFTKIKKNTGAYFTADGATVNCDMTSSAEGNTPETKDGKGGIKLSTLSGNKFDFTLKDTALQTGNAKVIVTYYAPEEGTTITFGERTQEISASDKWQKMRFDVTDIGNSVNYISANKDIYINSVRVVAAD